MICVPKPTKYEVIKWTGENFSAIKEFCGEKVFMLTESRNELNVMYEFNRKWQSCYPGDYVIKTRSGYFRVIRADEFDKMYDVLN